MSSILDQLTELYVFVDDFLTAHPRLADWRQSPHHTPAFVDAEVLTLALLQGCLGVASLKQTYRLVAHNYRSAFPQLCSYPQWIARLQSLSAPISALLMATTQLPAQSPAFYLIDAKPLPVCSRLRHGRVRLDDWPDARSGSRRVPSGWPARPVRANRPRHTRAARARTR